MNRLPPQPGEVIDRSDPVEFTWNGQKVSGFGGDTIASALTAAGVRVVSRSIKYRRPRGYMSNDYWDPNGLVQVGDDPNVRSAHRLIEPGMAVTAQNVWPSLDRDLRAVTGLASRFLTAGFYYKTFMRPQWLWPTYEKVLSTFSPGGRIDLDTPHRYHDKRYTHPDVVVAGGGPAGMSAAIAAAEAGAKVLLVEHCHRLGGHLLWGDEPDRALAAELAARVEAAGVEVLVDSTVTGRYEDNWTAIVQRNHPIAVERLIKARAKVLIAAPGLIERPYVFDGNDKPGVMLSGAVRRFVNMYAVRPGSTAVVFTANPDGDAAAADLERAGADVTLVDARQDENIVRAVGGSKAVRGVELGHGRSLGCDLLVTAVGWTAPTSLLNMSGDRPVYDEAAARFFPSVPIGNVLATGGLAGDGSLEELIAHAAATGRLAAARARSVNHRLQSATARALPVNGDEPEWPQDRRRALPRDPHPPLFRSTTHGMVDYSEDVSSKEMVGAAAEGYDSVELLKRYTTATMGPSQGKLETVNTVAVLAEARGQTIAEVGTTVWRPPYAPVTMGALGGRMFEPVRVSSVHPWHEANGATFMLAGQWVRPDHYGDPAGEVLNTRRNVGIMDVTPLGKLDLRGPDVPKLLSHLYTNKWMKLAVGSVRYGIMCGEDGVILDDGITGRLGDQHYMMTTTSSGAATVWEWAENWLQTEHPDWQVHITPVTSGYTSINVAGPESRTLMRRLVEDADLDPEAFRYMQMRTATVAGVRDCFMWRIGFTGELSFELHVPAGYGLAVWEALLEAGEDLGIRPFGVECQRIMRLEKGHFIVGQDTDGLTKAPAVGLRHLIKVDKHDFVGKPELARALEDTTEPVLVAIQPTDPRIVPDEAAQIVRPGTNHIIGRITSSRMSPTLERSICLGQVLPEVSEPGSELTVVMVDGRRITARVMGHHAHFDPEGERVRG
ncbi:MAG: 2Fe-2S iron-sulfur cluster-binding protein [bacterium]|nr:2Fe-2S iron-sulfur cluster-binding protein [bacterium]MDE0290368.1 2Fe-2S iron-sulfur cluster-binding protein [bacterium]MDE0438540.1 2Fe-2S iron-sulfur cluster-binding protein [bacterium]